VPKRAGRRRVMRAFFLSTGPTVVMATTPEATPSKM